MGVHTFGDYGPNNQFREPDTVYKGKYQGGLFFGGGSVPEDGFHPEDLYPSMTGKVSAGMFEDLAFNGGDVPRPINY